LKRISNKQRGVRCASRAKDGWRWKERRAGKLNGVVVQVLKTKKDKPVPANIVKTAATTCGEVVPYFAAYRAVNRIRRRSEVAEESPVSCSLFVVRGGTIGACARKKRGSQGVECIVVNR
jgi:hypothetical protein